MKHNIIKIYISEEVISDLDFELEKDLHISDEELWDIQTAPIPKGIHWSGEADPIRIETLQAMIDSAKKNGATYLEIMHHEDHKGYYVIGLTFSRDSKTFAEVEASARQAKIVELEADLEKFDRGRDTILAQLADLKSHSA